MDAPSSKAPQGEDPRVEELRAQLADAEKRNMRSLCTYCGHIEESADEKERFDKMADHIFACEKHPLRQVSGLLSELETLRLENAKLREALVAVDQHFAAEYWTSDDGKTTRPGTPDDNECPRAVNAVWQRLRAALDHSTTGTK